MENIRKDVHPNLRHMHSHLDRLSRNLDELGKIEVKGSTQEKYKEQCQRHFEKAKDIRDKTNEIFKDLAKFTLGKKYSASCEVMELGETDIAFTREIYNAADSLLKASSQIATHFMQLKDMPHHTPKKETHALGKGLEYLMAAAAAIVMAMGPYNTVDNSHFQQDDGGTQTTQNDNAIRTGVPLRKKENEELGI